MASRAKKKASINPQPIVAPQESMVADKNNNKWTKIHLATSIVLLLLLFFIIMLSPVLFANIKLSLSGDAESASEHSFYVSALDIMFAPVRGCNSGFRFLLEKMGAEVSTQSKYENVVALIAPLLAKDTVENVNSLGVTALVFSYVLFTMYLAAIALDISDIKLKKKGLLSLIGSGCLFAAALAYLIFTLTINISTMFSSSKMNASWGIWIIFFVAIAYFAINIATWVNGLKEKKNENV